MNQRRNVAVATVVMVMQQEGVLKFLYSECEISKVKFINKTDSFPKLSFFHFCRNYFFSILNLFSVPPLIVISIVLFLLGIGSLPRGRHRGERLACN